MPQAAGTSGIQRTVMVTPIKPVGRAPAPDLEWGSTLNLHGMRGVMPGGCLLDEHGADGLALVDATGDGEEEDVAAERPGVLGALVGNRDNP